MTLTVSVIVYVDDYELVTTSCHAQRAKTEIGIRHVLLFVARNNMVFFKKMKLMKMVQWPYYKSHYASMYSSLTH